mgnify:FL=1
MTQEELFKKLVAHCKEYGFVFPSSEIYDGLGAVYDYGQNGVELKNNIKRYWWDSMVKLHENIVGIDPEVAQAIADKLGLELEIMDMDFDSIITAVSAGKADMGMAGMTVTEERQKNVDFSQTYASAVQAIIVPDGSDIKTADDMEGKKIGVMQGFTGDLSCTEQFGEDAVVRFNKSAEAVMALTQGKIDCIVIDNEPAKKIIEANSGLTILDSKYSQEDYAIAFAKGNDGLRDAVDAALGELISDGTVEQIMNKYIVAD